MTRRSFFKLLAAAWAALKVKPMGFPDHGVPITQVAQITTDPGEIYTRLLGFAPTDGLGRVLFLDTFINGLAAWRIGNSGAGVLPALVGQEVGFANAFVAPLGVEFDPGPTSGGYSNMHSPHYLGQATRIGNEWAIQLPAFGAGTFPQISISFAYRHFTQANGRLAELRWNVNSDKKWAVNNNGSYVSLANTDMGIDSSYSDYWVQVKFVADWSTNKYVRLILGQTSFDLSTYTMPTTSISVPGHATPAILVQSGGTSFPVNAGYYLATQDEP